MGARSLTSRSGVDLPSSRMGASSTRRTRAYVRPSSRGNSTCRDLTFVRNLFEDSPGGICGMVGRRGVPWRSRRAPPDPGLVRRRDPGSPLSGCDAFRVPSSLLMASASRTGARRFALPTGPPDEPRPSRQRWLRGLLVISQLLPAAMSRQSTKLAKQVDVPLVQSLD